MARSRQQRRARRAEAAAEPRANSRAAAAPREARPAPEAPSVSQPRGGFIRESYAELKKVEWPSRPQVMTGTIVVIVAVAIVGIYLWLLDQGFKNLVEKVLI
jgi:preprotein translocase subunit SecE